MWIEGKSAHLRVHSSEARGFDAVKADLIAMRDRLSLEIENGPVKCPFRNRRGEPGHA